MFALRERRVHVTQARTRPPLQPVGNICPSAPAEPAARARAGVARPGHILALSCQPTEKRSLQREWASTAVMLRRTLRARAQEDFEMAVAKVMKKDSEKNVSLKKLWK